MAREARIKILPLVAGSPCLWRRGQWRRWPATPAEMGMNQTRQHAITEYSLRASGYSQRSKSRASLLLATASQPQDVLTRPQLAHHVRDVLGIPWTEIPLFNADYMVN